MHISDSEQKRRIKIAEAKLALVRLLNSYDLTPLEVIELLTEEAYRTTNRYRFEQEKDMSEP